MPNDAIAVRAGFDPAMAKKIQGILVTITDAQARTILPKHYTRFIASSDGNYKVIRDAGVAGGALRPRQ